MLLCCKEVARMRKTLEALFYGELQAVDMRMKQSGRIARAVTEATELEEWISANCLKNRRNSWNSC